MRLTSLTLKAMIVWPSDKCRNILFYLQPTHVVQWLLGFTSNMLFFWGGDKVFSMWRKVQGWVKLGSHAKISLQKLQIFSV